MVVSVDGSKQITFGTEVQDNDRIYYPSQFVHDANGNGNVAVIGARYNSSTTAEVNTTQAYVITISGTTPTIKTPVVIATYTYKYGYSVYDASANKTVCIYGDGSKVYYNVCSMSSGTITSGTETEIATGNISEATQEFAYAGCYNPFTQQIGITYHDSSNYYYLRSGKISGASITWSTAIQVDPSTANKHVNLVNANSSNSNTLVLYWVNYDSAFNTWTIGSSGVTASNLTPTNFFGVASNSATTTNPVQINVPGSINNAQTGLTVDKDYYVTDAGLIKERTTTTTTPDTNPTASTITEQNGTAYSYYGNSIAYESTSGYYVRGRRVASSNYPCVESGTWGSLSTGITWNTPTVLSSNSLRGNKVMVATGGGYAHLAYCTRENSNENAKVTPVAISGSGSLSLGTTTTVNTLASSGSDTVPYGVEYDTSQDTILVFFFLGWRSGYVNKVFPLQMSGANYSYSSSDAVTLTSGIDIHPNSLNTVFDPDTNRTILFYNKNDITEAIHGIVLSCSGTTITKGATQSPSLSTPTSNCWTNVAYDTQNNKIIFMYYVNSPINYAPKYSIVTVTGGGTNTLSFTSDAYVFANTSQIAQACTLAWNGDANKLFMVYPKSPDSHIQCNTFTSNGSTLTTISEGEISTNEMTDSEPNENTASVFVTGKGVSYSLGNADSSPGIVNFTLSIGSTTLTVVNGSVFAGTALSATALELKTFPASTIVGKASAGITKGKPVIVEADGDFAPVQIAGEAGGLQTATALPNQASSSPFKARVAHNWDDNETVAMYNNSNSSNYPVAVKVIIDGSSAITYGTPTVINSSTSPNNNKVIYHPPSGNYAFLYNTSNNNTYAKVGALASNGSWSFGSGVIATGYTCYEADIMYWEAGNKIVVGYQPANANGTWTLLMTVSGTSTTFSNETQNQNSNTEGDINLIPVNSTYYMLLSRNNSNGDYETRMCSISGSAITYNKTNNVIANASNEYSMQPRGAMINTTKVGVVYLSSASTNGQMHGVVGTVSGNTVTWGSEIDILLGQNIRQSGPGRLTFTSAANQGSSSKKEFLYTSTINHPSYKPVWVKINASNDTLALDSYEIYDTLGYQQSGAGDGGASNAFNNNTDSYIISTTYSTSSQNGVNASSVQVLKNSTIASNLTAENYIGIAQETVSTNEDVKVTTISGVDANQSNLTPAQIYYVQTDGTLSTTAGSPSVVAGTAIAATQLLVSRS